MVSNIDFQVIYQYTIGFITLRSTGFGINLLLPPINVHQFVHGFEIGPQILATAYYSIITFGLLQTILNFTGD